MCKFPQGQILWRLHLLGPPLDPYIQELWGGEELIGWAPCQWAGQICCSKQRWHVLAVQQEQLTWWPVAVQSPVGDKKVQRCHLGVFIFLYISCCSGLFTFYFRCVILFQHGCINHVYYRKRNVLLVKTFASQFTSLCVGPTRKIQTNYTEVTGCNIKNVKNFKGYCYFCNILGKNTSFCSFCLSKSYTICCSYTAYGT